MVRSSRRGSGRESGSRSDGSGPVEDVVTHDRRPAAESRLAGYRLLRRIASGERADIFLAAVDGGADEPAPLVVVRVYDAAASGTAIALEIEAMSTDASGSLPALYDVATLDDGRCALAVERLAGATLARVIAERRITPGEAVTILAPITVAVGELARRGFVHTRMSLSDVLLDGRGRPRLVGLGGLERLPAAAHERTPLLRAGHVVLADLVNEVTAATERPEAFRAAIELVQSRLTTRPFMPCEAELERVLFAAADPAPVSGIVVAAPRGGLPSRVTVPMEARSAAGPGSDVDATEADASDAPRSALRALLDLAQLPAFFADGGRAGPDAAPRASVNERGGVLTRVRTMLRRRRPVLLVGSLMGGGALVLLLTLVPPGGSGAASTDARPAVSARIDAAPDAEPPETTAPPEETTALPDDATAGDDVVVAVQALLARRAMCFDELDLACLEAVVQSGSAAEIDDVAAMGAARAGGDVPPAFDPTGITVAAEMGSAVLVTVPYSTDEREPASLLVMRGEAGWRLREVFG